MTSRLLQTLALIVSALLIASLLYWQIEPVHRGGPVMIPIAMCSFFAMAISFERLLYYLLSGQRQSPQWLDRLREALKSGRWDEALTMCQRPQGLLAQVIGIQEEPVSRVIRAGLAAPQRDAQSIERAMEEAAMEELPHIEKHLRWLATIAQVATLLGLLGTVTGMVRCFRIIQEKSTGTNPVNPGDLAGGIWEALLTTVAGLAVAIPTIVAYNYLANRAVEIRNHLERATSLLMGWICSPASHAPSPKKSS